VSNEDWERMSTHDQLSFLLFKNSNEKGWNELPDDTLARIGCFLGPGPELDQFPRRIQEPS